MRESTERLEAVKAGTVVLVGTCVDRIVYYVHKLLKGAELYQQMCCVQNPYGDGEASTRIANVISEFANKKVVGTLMA